MIGRIILGVLGVLLLLPGIRGIGSLFLSGADDIVLMLSVPVILVGIVGVFVFGSAFERFSSRPLRNARRGRK